MHSIAFRYQNSDIKDRVILNAINDTPTPEALYAELFRVRLRLKYLESPECMLKYSKQDQERERRYFTVRFRNLLLVKDVFSKSAQVEYSEYERII